MAEVDDPLMARWQRAARVMRRIDPEAFEALLASVEVEAENTNATARIDESYSEA